MYFDFNEKSSVLFIFFLHGLVFATLLFLKGKETEEKSNYWLSAFTLLSSLYIAPFMFGYAGWYGNQPYRDILFYIPFQQLFLLPPVLYYYFKTLFDKSFAFGRKDFLHFLPAVLYFLYSLIVFIVDKIILHEYFFYADGKDKDLSTWYQISGFISLVFYLFLSLKSYKEYKRIIYNTLSFADTLLFQWAKRFLMAFLFLLAIRVVFFVLNPEWGEFGKKFWYYVAFSVLFYLISISGYVNAMRSMISFTDLTPDANSQTADKISNSTTATQSNKETDNHDLMLWKNKLEQLMLVDKLYENPELTITHLCTKTGTHSKKISEVINQGFGMNFNDFINHYRTNAVINKLEQGEHTRVTLLSIALDCGFNSKSTFNRAFKRSTAVTPKEYIDKNQFL